MDLSEDTDIEFRTLRDYDLIKVQGKGAQGTVYKARIRDTGEIIALKVLSIPRDSEAYKFAINEIEALETVSENQCHPFMACYYNHFYDGDNILIEMEFVEGQELQKWAEKYRNNPRVLTHNLVLIISDICSLLRFMETKGIIHRDIKPENILITEDNIPKLIDFGLACELTKCPSVNPTYAPMCCVGRVGTPIYMAPETVQTGNAYAASDIWSLAATMFYVSTLKYPFTVNMNNVQEVLQAVSFTLPAKLNTDNPVLDKIVNLSLNKDPSLRPTATQIIEYIQKSKF